MLTLLALIAVFLFLAWLLLTRVPDGLTWAPIIGMGMGFLIGRAAGEVFGLNPDRAGGLLALLLFVLPFAYLYVGGKLGARRARRQPSPEERARLEAEIKWQSYDPAWLVELAKAQHPDNPGLAVHLAAKTRCTEAGGRIWFVPPALLAAKGHETYLRMPDGRVAWIYFLPWDELAAVEIYTPVKPGTAAAGT